MGLYMFGESLYTIYIMNIKINIKVYVIQFRLPMFPIYLFVFSYQYIRFRATPIQVFNYGITILDSDILRYKVIGIKGVSKNCYNKTKNTY